MRKPEPEFHEPLIGWQKTNGDAGRGIWEQILAADPLSGDSTCSNAMSPAPTP
ncbi:UNVERIFIED_ORG: hypothetical protein ABIB52_003223 [Arthrobacter sp. UYCu721]